MTTKFKAKPMMMTTHNLQALKLKKKLEAIPAEKLTDAQKLFLVNEKLEADGIITIRDAQDAKQQKAQDAEDKRKDDEHKADIEAAAKKLLDERKRKADAEKKETPAKVKHGKAKSK